MSTHCALGVEMEDGSIMGCYVHYDGGSMAPRIQRYLEEHTTTDLAILITQAQSSGGMRSFHSADEFGNDPETDFLDGDQSYIITSQNWEEDHMGTHAWCLVNHKDSTFAVKERA
jgi:hypothetical protein